MVSLFLGEFIAYYIQVLAVRGIGITLNVDTNSISEPWHIQPADEINFDIPYAINSPLEQLNNDSMELIFLVR